jgi:alpha/beta superfamily hydrolase
MNPEHIGRRQAMHRYHFRHAQPAFNRINPDLTQEPIMHLLDVTPSSPVLFALEPFNAFCDYVAGHAWRSDALPEGDGHPVLVFPGLGVSGAATADLRKRLQQLGYAVYDWKHGVNQGPGAAFDNWLALLGDHLREIHTEHDSQVTVIGWSFGGIYARELAKEYPQLVRQVITLATPFGKSGSANANTLFPLAAGLLFDAALLHRLSELPPVLSSSVYSQSDGIVGWQDCLATESDHHRNIEVKGVSHFGMVHHPDVLNVVADLLKNRDSIGDLAVAS